MSTSMNVVAVEVEQEVTVGGAPVRVLCTFTAIDDATPAIASVHALHEMLPIGSIKWVAHPNDDHEVSLVYVRPEWRRRGVASLLWAAAEGVADAQGWPRPEHSRTRTPEGDAWAKSVGAEGVDDVEPTMSEDEYAPPTGDVPHDVQTFG